MFQSPPRPVTVDDDELWVPPSRASPVDLHGRGVCDRAPRLLDAYDRTTARLVAFYPSSYHRQSVCGKSFSLLPRGPSREERKAAAAHAEYAQWSWYNVPIGRLVRVPSMQQISSILQGFPRRAGVHPINRLGTRKCYTKKRVTPPPPTTNNPSKYACLPTKNQTRPSHQETFLSAYSVKRCRCSIFCLRIHRQ